MDPPECLIQGLKARRGSEEGIKASVQVDFLLRRRMRFVGLEIGIQLPELTAYLGEFLPVRRVEGNERVDEPLGMNPTQAMTQDVELPRTVADYGQVLGEAMGCNTLPNRAPSVAMRRCRSWLIPNRLRWVFQCASPVKSPSEWVRSLSSGPWGSFCPCI